METNYEASHAVRPAIYLNTNTPVLDGAVVDPQNDILTFYVDNQIETAHFDYDNHQITITVPSTVDLTSMEPTITVPNGASVLPASGTVQDFTSQVTYTVTSADGFQQVWTVTCQVLSAFADIEDFGGEGITATINSVSHTVTFMVPEDTDVTSLSPSNSVSNGATIGVVSAFGVTDLPLTQDFSTPVTYRVTAAAGNTQDWTVTCYRIGDSVSFYVQHYLQNLTGWGYSLYQEQEHSGVINMEVTAPVLTDAGLSENTAHPGHIVSGQVPVDGSLVLRRYYGRTLHSAFFNENGGTAVRDVKNARYGTQIESPVTTRAGYASLGWFDCDSGVRADFPLTLHSDVTLRAEWQRLTGSAGEITDFWVPGQVGASQIDTGIQRITFTMPADSDLTAVAPVITLADGMTSSPVSGEIQDFTTSDASLWGVEYSVTDGVEIPWVWYVEAATEYKGIRSFSAEGQLGKSIIEDTSDRNHAITVTMPIDSDLSALQTRIVTDAGTTAFIINSSGFDDWYVSGEAKTMDLSDVPHQTVVHSSTSTTTSYTETWTVTCYLSSILGFSFPGQVGETIYDAKNHLITVHMPCGTNMTNLTASVQLADGASIYPLPGTVRDYSGDAYFDVTQGSGAPVTWTIRCIEDFNTQNDITELTIPTRPDQIGASVIDSDHHTVRFTMPYGADVAALAPVITASEGAIVPASGTAHDFNVSSTRLYMVYAEDNSPQIWTVECIIERQDGYRAEHYLQNLIGDGYTLQDTDHAVAEPGSTVTATPKTYPGFTENQLYSGRIASGTVTEDGSLVLRLYYDRDTFHLQYEENGGSSIEDVSAIRYGTVITEPAAPTRDGHTFVAWYQDALFTNVYDFSQQVTEDLTLYAKWVVTQYTVSYLAPDGTTLVPAVTQDTGTDIEKPVDPVIDGYAFMGWYLEPALINVFEFNQALSGNMTLYASFKRNGRAILSFEVPGQVARSEIDAEE